VTRIRGRKQLTRPVNC